MMERTIEASFWSVSTSRMKEWSILSWSSGSLRRVASDEYPVPKSSSEKLRPRRLSVAMVCAVWVKSVMTRLSVNSSFRLEGCTPLCSKIPCSMGTKSGWLNWRALTLTDKVRPAVSGTRCQRASSAQAVRSTHLPISTMIPLSSAARMNSPG